MKTMSRSSLKASLSLLLVAAVVLFASPSALACPNCYSSALGIKGIAALKSGILILLIPTTLLFAGLIWLIYRRRNSSSSDAGDRIAEDSAASLTPLTAAKIERL